MVCGHALLSHLFFEHKIIPICHVLLAGGRASHSSSTLWWGAFLHWGSPCGFQLRVWLAQILIPLGFQGLAL